MLNTPDRTVKNPILVRERRAALIRAAIDIFFEKGYHASSVTEIAKAAGVSHGSVYNYVDSKADLLFMICEDHLHGYERIVTEALAKVSDPRGRLEALLVANVEAVFSHRKHYVVMLRELHSVERDKRHAFFELAARQRKICEDVLREARDRGGIVLDDPLITANILVYLPKLIVSRGWDLKGKVADEQVSAAIIAFMRRALGLEEGATKHLLSIADTLEVALPTHAATQGSRR